MSLSPQHGSHWPCSSHPSTKQLLDRVFLLFALISISIPLARERYDPKLQHIVGSYNFDSPFFFFLFDFLRFSALPPLLALAPFSSIIPSPAYPFLHIFTRHLPSTLLVRFFLLRKRATKGLSHGHVPVLYPVCLTR